MATNFSNKTALGEQMFANQFAEQRRFTVVQNSKTSAWYKYNKVCYLLSTFKMYFTNMWSIYRLFIFQRNQHENYTSWQKLAFCEQQQTNAIFFLWMATTVSQFNCSGNAYDKMFVWSTHYTRREDLSTRQSAIHISQNKNQIRIHVST